MSFSSTILKTALIILAASHVAVAGPVPDLFGNALAAGGGGEDLSGGSVSDSNQAAGGDSLLSGLDILELLSGNGGAGGESDSGEPVSYSKGVGREGGKAGFGKPGSHSEGVGGSSLAGARHRQGKKLGQPADAFSGFGESAQGGSVSGGAGLLNILSGNGGDGGGASNRIDLLGILRKKDL